MGESASFGETPPSKPARRRMVGLGGSVTDCEHQTSTPVAFRLHADEN
jgi:hypothetical protein